jgi:lambda family phage portal protein
MGEVVRIAQDLTIGQPNPQREYGSRINNAWLKERKAQQAAQAKTKKTARNYAGAVPSRTNMGWGAASKPVNWHIWQGLQALRARSREQVRNNDYARKFIAMCKSNVVGHMGIQMQSKASDGFGPDKQPDRLAQDAIESHWKTWCRAEHCDVAGKLSFKAMCQLIVATVATDGECLVRLHQRGDFSFSLQVIDPELLDLRLNKDLGHGIRIRMGVEMDVLGKPIAYHILDKADESLYQSSYYTASHIRIPAHEIKHLFLHEMVDQARGVPWMASALVRMKNLHGYEEAAVIAARIGASKMGFFKASEDGAGASDLADDEDIVADEFIQEAEPGAFEVLPDGYDFQAFNPDYPHQQFGEFVKASLRGISSGLGVAYPSLGNDLEGVNFSSIRAGVLEERETWKLLQDWLIDDFCLPVFESWLTSQLARGAIRVPSTKHGAVSLPASGFEKFKQVTFQGRRWAWVDPLKDMKANRESVEQGFKSRSEIIREQGRDPEEVWNELAKEEKIMRELGLIADPALAKGV